MMTTPNAGEDAETPDSAYTAGENAQWYNHSGK